MSNKFDLAPCVPWSLLACCGIAKLAGLHGRPRLLQPESALGSLLFEILKNPRRHYIQPVGSWSALPFPVTGRPLWDQGAQQDVTANL